MYNVRYDTFVKLLKICFWVVESGLLRLLRTSQWRPLEIATSKKWNLLENNPLNFEVSLRCCHYGQQKQSRFYMYSVLRLLRTFPNSGTGAVTFKCQSTETINSLHNLMDTTILNHHFTTHPIHFNTFLPRFVSVDVHF